MEEKKPRLLRANEISVRVQSVLEHGAILLLFTNSRVVQTIMDATYGVLNWQISYEMEGPFLTAIVSVWDPGKKQWISKQDVGTESKSEREKGLFSDALKRTCVRFGVAKELYTSPFIWIPATKIAIERKDDRLVTNERFHVDDIEYDEERNISYLKIMNGTNQVVYVWGKPKENTDGNVAITMVTDEKMEQLRKELQRTGVSMEAVLGRYCITSETQLTEDIYRKAMSSLKRTKSLKQVA